ncbi:urotensin-2 receptor [Stegostoma tigrinum]|uniref:urotensin-2 receptor n=1 Tax=Stegostoma tigrinum TaxID=3053191 RepID=UPI00202B8367|nr:urotensin-2 receptor [Stegostoma tigrinum]
MATEADLSAWNLSTISSTNQTVSERVAPASLEELAVTCSIGTILSLMFLTGVAGNIYTLVLMCQSMRPAASMYIYIMSLALADLLYLSTIPFIVCTYFAKRWYFGDLGCRLLFSVDFLTMHASIFTLTVMSTERYLAVVKPLDTVKRSKSYRKAIAAVIWLASLLLALPMLLIIRLMRIRDKSICAPTWSLHFFRIYMTVLFTTSILAPGIIIGYLYIRLARTYWVSQLTTFNDKQTKRSPNQKVLYMIFAIVLVFWACFLPFWVWQMIEYYQSPLPLSQKTRGHINYLMTCLTYSNSCINPFLYTLLTKNYKEYLGNQHRSMSNSSSFHGRNPRFQRSCRRSLSSSSQQYTESMTLSQISGSNISTISRK